MNGKPNGLVRMKLQLLDEAEASAAELAQARDLEIQLVLGDRLVALELVIEDAVAVAEWKLEIPSKDLLHKEKVKQGRVYKIE